MSGFLASVFGTPSRTKSDYQEQEEVTYEADPEESGSETNIVQDETQAGSEADVDADEQRKRGTKRKRSRGRGRALQKAATIDDGADLPGTGRKVKRRVTKLVEVPVRTKVKVPVLTKRVVPCTVKMKVRTRVFREVPGFDEVEEVYHEMEPRQRTRQRVVWVKKIVEETYTEQVPVRKTRMVRKPVTRIEEAEEWRVVDVPTTKVVDFEGFRVDEVEDRKTVETTVVEEFELRPHHINTYEEGTIEHDEVEPTHTNRVTGTKVYVSGDVDEDDDEVDNIPEDSTLQGSAPEVMVVPSDAAMQGMDMVAEDHALEEEEEEDAADYDMPDQDNDNRNDDDDDDVAITELDLREERVTLTNQGGYDVDLSGWSIHDQQFEDGEAMTNRFEFPQDFVLAPGASVSIYSGRNAEEARTYDGEEHLLWEEKKHRPVWNDRGDTAFLVDAEGVALGSFTAVADRASVSASPVRARRRTPRRAASAQKKKKKTPKRSSKKKKKKKSPASATRRSSRRRT